MIPSNVLFLDRNLNIGVCSSQFFKSILVLPWSSKIGIPLYMELYCKKLWDITMPNLGQKKCEKYFHTYFRSTDDFGQYSRHCFSLRRKKTNSIWDLWRKELRPLLTGSKEFLLWRRKIRQMVWCGSIVFTLLP